MTLNDNLVKIAVHYTKNALTYGSAYHLMIQAINEFEYDGGNGHSSDEAKYAAAVKFLGWPQDREATLTIELGFNGNRYEWFVAGNRPKFWDMTRKEYHLCLARSMDPKKTAAETDAVATCSAEKKA